MDVPSSIRSELTVNSRLEIEVTAGPRRGIYQSRVEDVTDGGVTIARPSVGWEPVQLEPGDSVRCRFTTPRACYQFDSSVVACGSGAVPTVVLSLPRRWERLQRRSFARVEVAVPVRYCREDDPVAGMPRVPTTPARTRDLSGGGCALVAAEPLSPGTILTLQLTLPPGEVLFLKARVVRVIDPNPAGGSTVGLRFLTVADADRDAIVRFLFREERRRRTSGLA